jgi:hypothetical protein
MLVTVLGHSDIEKLRWLEGDLEYEDLWLDCKTGIQEQIQLIQRCQTCS